MNQKIGWLYDELPRLVSDGVLAPEAAEALRRHYGPLDPHGSRAGWGQILLASFGALLVGGGVILILAHNWDGLSRPARAAIAVSILLAAQGLTLFATARRPHSMAWIEATSGLLVAAVGAAIALVGQTYHLGGSFEGLMRAWLWLVVLIPYVTGSTLASIGFWALLVVRVVSLPWRDAPWDPWILVLAGFPFIVLRIRRAPHSWATSLLALSATTAIFIVGSFVAGQSGWSGLWAVFQVTLLGAAIAAAAWPPGAETTRASWRGRLFVPAWIVLVVIGTVLTFDDSWRSASNLASSLRNPSVFGVILAALACAAYASMRVVQLVSAGHVAIAAAIAAAPLVALTHGLALGKWDDGGWIVFNLWLLAVGILTLREGIRTVNLGAANRGLLALSLLVVARFFDTDLSFLARGLAFVTLGIGCLALNFRLMRRVRKGTS